MVRMGEDQTGYEYLRGLPTLSDESLELIAYRNPVFEQKEKIDNELRVAAEAIRRAWGTVDDSTD